jgi:GrpB-like predicted nucleotidyltransferase (UPF0157 family)
MSNEEALSRVDIVEYDPRWAGWFEQERDFLARMLNGPFDAHEHIGSTAVPGLKAKPIIDMMASLRELPSKDQISDRLHPLGYRLILTGMRERFLFRKIACRGKPMFHLHLVASDTWARRKERLMRDYLRNHPEAVESYGELKERLAREHDEDSIAYTRAKTSFIQTLMDAACDESGIARFDVWTS